MTWDDAASDFVWPMFGQRPQRLWNLAWNEERNKVCKIKGRSGISPSWEVASGPSQLEREHK